MATHINNVSRSELARILEAENQKEVERLIPLLVYLAVISMTGIIGNGLVCYIFHPMRNTSSSRWFIYFLGVVDLLMCVVVLPIEIATTCQQFNFTNVVLCKINLFINSSTLLSIGSIFVIIAVDRYRKVCSPFGWQIDIFKAKVICGVLVGVSFTFAAPMIGVYKIHKVTLPNSDIVGSECSFRKDKEGLSLKVIYIVCLMVLFAGSMLTICVLFCCIGVSIKKHVNKARHSGSTLPGKQEQHSTTDVEDTSVPSVNILKVPALKEHSKPTKIKRTRAKNASLSMFLISLAAVICYTPLLSLLLVRNIILNFQENMSDEGRAVYKFFLRFGFMSCAINPFIYGFSDSKFRQRCNEVSLILKHLICYYCKKHEAVTMS